MGAEMLSKFRAVETSDRASRSLYEDELARREGERRRAQSWVLTSPFYLAVELAKEGEPQSRLFLMSRGETQSAFRDHGIVSPFSPIAHDMRTLAAPGSSPKT